MKKMKIKLLTFVFAATFISSCEDDLNVPVVDSQQNLADQFYSNPAAYKQGLAGIYGNLSLTGTDGPGSSNLQGIDAGFSQYMRCVWNLQTLTTDEAIWSYEGDGGIAELQRNTWTDINPFLRGMFGRGMYQVALVNEYLRQTSPGKLSSRGITDAQLLSDISAYRNEARVLRALAYYHLLDLFGKAAFNTEVQDVGAAGTEISGTQLFNYIESELLELLPSLATPRSNEQGRLDQAFARMLLAKLYLNAEVYTGTARYNDCVTQLNSIISSGYSLEANYLHNFTADNHTSSEMIFSIQSDGTFTQNFGPTTVMINGSVGSIEQNGLSLGVGAGGWGGALRLRKQFVQKFDGQQFDNDARKTIISGSRPIDITDVANRDQGFILAKYSNKTSTGTNGVNTTFVDTDFPLFRLADAYLMYAECAKRGASGASESTAIGYINLLRERANNGSTAANISTSDLTLDFILDERARELHWEGHRRQDLIRFGKYTGGTYNWAWKGNGSTGVAIPQFRKLFPIPALSLVANPNLTQNPGY